MDRRPGPICIARIPIGGSEYRDGRCGNPRVGARSKVGQSLAADRRRPGCLRRQRAARIVNGVECRGHVRIPRATDSDGTISKVDFYRANTLINTATTAPYSIVWANVPAGTYSLTAKATDNNNGTKTSTAVSITVAVPPNVSPTIAITSPANNTIVNGPTVAINATAIDSDGTVKKIDFFDGTTNIGSVTGNAAIIAIDQDRVHEPELLDAAFQLLELLGGMGARKACAIWVRGVVRETPDPFGETPV